MVRFLVATHGTLADGFKSTMSILMGKEIAEKIETINAYCNENESSPKQLIENYIDSVGNDQLIIFTDVMFGSVNQFVMPYVNRSNIFVLTGVNFPLMLEVISKYSFGEESVEEDYIRSVVAKAREQILFVNDEMQDSQTANNEEDFF